MIGFSIANLRIYGHILVRSNKTLNEKKLLKIDDKNFTAVKKIKKSPSATFDFWFQHIEVANTS